MLNSGPPQQVALLPFVCGDTWDGIQQVGPVTFNDAPPPVALDRVDMHFRKAWDDIDPTAALSSEVITGQGTITIVDAVTWFCSIPAQSLKLPPGVWVWDLQFTDADGGVFTPVGGYITCARDITRLPAN